MEFVSRTSTNTDTAKVIEELTHDLDGTYQFGILFISGDYRDHLSELLSKLLASISVQTLMGCTCLSVIGSHEELEDHPGMVLFLAKLPGAKIVPFSISQNQMGQFESISEWHSFFDVYPNENPTFFLLSDPFMFDTQMFIDGINMSYPGQTLVGGIASGATHPGENMLFINQEFFDSGAVGLILTGGVTVKTVVSQGCHPIGNTYTVTKAERNMIFSVANHPVLEILQDILDKCTPTEKELATQALFVGIVMDEYLHTFKRGDFLIRGVIGADEQAGAIAIADTIQTGQTIQFHVRDGKTAKEDLVSLLTSLKTSQKKDLPQAALVFNCNGRGQHMYQEHHHDIKAIQNHVGPIPVAGFFCAGEIGPVGKRNYLHGFTNSMALFYPAGDSELKKS